MMIVLDHPLGTVAVTPGGACVPEVVAPVPTVFAFPLLTVLAFVPDAGRSGRIDYEVNDT